MGGVETIAVGLVTYFNPASATAINASILIAGTAIIEICNQFVTQADDLSIDVGDNFSDDKGNIYKVKGFDKDGIAICEKVK